MSIIHACSLDVRDFFGDALIYKDFRSIAEIRYPLQKSTKLTIRLRLQLLFWGWMKKATPLNSGFDNTGSFCLYVLLVSSDQWQSFRFMEGK
jgi:hypothetical protein